MARLVEPVPVDRGGRHAHRVDVLAPGRLGGGGEPHGAEELLREVGPVVVQPVPVHVGQERRVQEPDGPLRRNGRLLGGSTEQEPFCLLELVLGPLHVDAAHVRPGEAVAVADVVQTRAEGPSASRKARTLLTTPRSAPFQWRPGPLGHSTSASSSAVTGRP